MPGTFGAVPQAAWQRTRQRGQRLFLAIEQSFGSFEGTRVARAEQRAAAATDRQAFLRNRPAHDDPHSGDRRKPLPAPICLSTGGVSADPFAIGEIARTRVELGNLAARRALRDEMVEAYGEGPAGAAFESLGVALKGEAKFAPLDDETVRKIQDYPAERIFQAQEAIEEAVSWQFGSFDDLKSWEDGGLYLEVLGRSFLAHPKYGTAFFTESDANALASSAAKSLEKLERRLTLETDIEEYLQPRFGHGDHGRPISFDQALIDYQARNRQHVRASDAEMAELKAKFRERCYQRVSEYFRSHAIRFIANEYPLFSAAKRELIAARNEQVYVSMSRIVPRELARFITFIFGAIWQRELSYPQPIEAPTVDR